jgi:hypothetical protein
LWIQNTAYTWKSVYDRLPIPLLQNLHTRIHNLQPGTYNVAIIDTTTGNVISIYRARCRASDGLPLSIPELKTDVAVKIAPAAH